MTFVQALQKGDVPSLSAIPKADRHCHSILSASLESIERWAGAPIVSPPIRMPDFDAMRVYCHSHLYPHIYNRSGFEFTAEQAIREAILDGVATLEMSLDVNFIQFYETGVDGFVSFILGAGERNRGKIDFRPEVGVSKNRAPESQIELAMECIDSGAFRSLDLYGNERAQEPEVYVQLYRHAARRGLKLKAHVGEFGSAALVERTLRVLGLQEVQHGVAAAASKQLMRTLRQEQVRLNVCPTSNVALSVVENLGTHPIRALVDSGVRVSVSSDDKTVFGNTVSQEYLALTGAGVLTPEELDRIRRDSLAD